MIKSPDKSGLFFGDIFMKVKADAWLDQVHEEIVEPGIQIVDPHHHLWELAGQTYFQRELKADTASHNVVKTVYMECGRSYYDTGPDHLKPVGESAFVLEQARQSNTGEGAYIAAMVGRADLRLGDQVNEVLDAHMEVSEGLFKGIRHAGARVENREGMSIFAGRAPAGLYLMPEFQAGVRLLGEKGYSYDTWHYFFQNQDYLKLAQAAPNTQMILDHLATPTFIEPFSNKREEVIARWKRDLSEISRCENVVMKLGGMAMPDNGFDCFGPERCMMESNFPVDRLSISYHVLFNGMKKIVADFSAEEKHQMFYGTASRVYRLSES